MKNCKSEEPLRLGLLGLGTVGQALIGLIEKRGNAGGRKIKIAGVSARTRHRDRDVDISSYPWFDDAVALARSPDIDVFVEVAGGLNTALEASLAALEAGKHLVTANKAMLAERGHRLLSAASERDRMIGFEAAVCGAIPAVKVLRESLAGNRIDQVQGIFNGTCNYIFAQMTAGETFAEALADAQAKGFAEADPTLDVGGGDAAHKTALMANLISGEGIDFAKVYVEGITRLPQQVINAAQQNEHVVKLLGQCKRTSEGLAVWVYPAAVPMNHPLAGVNGVMNAVSYHADAAGFGMMTGPGAGGDATASAVLSDVMDIAQNRMSVAGGLSADREQILLPITQRRGRNWVADQGRASALRKAGAKVQEAVSGLWVTEIYEKELQAIVAHEEGAWLRVEGETEHGRH